MRLVACILGSLILHVCLLSWTTGNFHAPALNIAAKTNTVDLRIRTRVQDSTLAPEVPEEKVAPTPPPKPKATPKPLPKPTPKKPVVEKRKKPREKPEPPKQPAESVEKVQQKPEQQYVSDPVKVPRKVVRAEYLNNPPPEYPAQARRRQQEGTCTLLVDVDADGLVSNVTVQKSSGHALLDSAATRAVSRWRFAPAAFGDRRVASRVIVPIHFKLEK